MRGSMEGATGFRRRGLLFVGWTIPGLSYTGETFALPHFSFIDSLS